jgi:hypothetical protein
MTEKIRAYNVKMRKLYPEFFDFAPFSNIDDFTVIYDFINIDDIINIEEVTFIDDLMSSTMTSLALMT